MNSTEELPSLIANTLGERVASELELAVAVCAPERDNITALCKIKHLPCTDLYIYR